MIADETWVGLALCSEKSFFKSKVCLLRVKGVRHELATTVVQCYWGGGGVGAEAIITVQIHPLLWESLSIAADAVQDSAIGTGAVRSGTTVRIQPAVLPKFPVEHPFSLMGELQEPMEAPRDLLGSDAKCHCVVQILYHPEGDESFAASALRDGLLGRYVQAQSTMLLATGEILMVVLQVIVDGERQDGVVRIGMSDTTLTVEVVPSPTSADEDTGPAFVQVGPVSAKEASACPGYEPLVEEIVGLLQPRGKSGEACLPPTGVLLTGGAGVGKTRIAANVAQRLGKRQIRWINPATDLSLESPHHEDGANTDDLFYVVDGLRGDSNEDKTDDEYNRIVASLAVLLDSCAAFGIPILATSRDANIQQVTKAGRLETTVEIHAPDQQQREEMLAQWFPRRWVAGLSKLTAGFVASDLARLQRRAQENDAMESWNELCAIANSIVPSQLAALDVQKPKRMIQLSSGESTVADVDWSAHHMLCFEDICGYDAMKRSLFRTVVLPWRRLLDARSSDDTHSSTIDPPTGVLFHGPSGCGKTVAAQCLGSSLGLPMIHVRTATEILSPWIGGSEGLVRSLFAKARYAAPCILFLDEIDSIASNRDVEGGSGGVMSRVLSTLLNEMDGVGSSNGPGSLVLVIACSNRRESLDTALLRPGRLEEHIELSYPTAADMRAILARALSKTPLEGAALLDAIVQQLVARQVVLTGADVYGICREAVLHALRTACGNDSVRLQQQDFDYAMASWFQERPCGA